MMGDAFLVQALQNITNAVDELKKNQLQLNEVLNDRFETLEGKVDAILNIFVTAGIEGVPVKKNIQELARPKGLVTNEISPDSGNGTTPSGEIQQPLTNCHLSEEDPSSTEYERNKDSAYSVGVFYEAFQTLTPDIQMHSDTRDPLNTDTDADQFPISIQETTDEGPVSVDNSYLGETVEKDKFRSMLLRPRSPSPLPSRPERKEVPHSKFRRLKTRASEDNRMKYFANEMDIKFDSSENIADGFAEVLPPPTVLQLNNRQKSNTNKTTASQDNSEENSESEPDTEQISQQLGCTAEQTSRQSEDILEVEQTSRQTPDISEETSLQALDISGQTSQQTSSYLDRPNRQSPSNFKETNQQSSADPEQSNLQPPHILDSRQEPDDLERNGLSLSDSGLKNFHEDDNRLVREAHLRDDGTLNSEQRTNVGKIQSDSARNQTVSGETDEEEMSETSINHEVEEETEDNLEDNKSEMFDSTARIERILCEQEKEAAANEDLKSSDGLDTVICIDTSTSMTGEPLRKALELLSDFIDGVENAAAEYELEENIAVVTFGKENKILQHFTNDYDLVRDSLGSITAAGGPSPLWLGLALSFTEISQRGHVLKLTSRKVPPRIILVTDGFGTSAEDLDGGEKTEPNTKVDETITALIQMNLSVIQSVSPVIVADDNNQESLARIAAMTNGTLVQNMSQIHQLNEYFRAQRALDDILTKYDGKTLTVHALQDYIRSEVPGLSSSSSNEIINVVKKETSIIQDVETYESIDTGATPDEVSRVEKLCFTLKPNWSRVRVTPDWTGDESRKGLVGTVISARKKGKVKVLWDDGLQETFRFGEDDVYEVHVVDVPKYLDKDEEIAVGVFVVRGPDWRWQNQDGGPGSVGVVIKIENGNVVHVVWPDGKLGNYRFGYTGKYDIQVCPNQTRPCHYVWEYMESTGGPWSMFPSDFMNDIEKLYQEDPTGKSDLQTKDTMYVLDLESKTITDANSMDMPWNIRRKEIQEEEWKELISEQ